MKTTAGSPRAIEQPAQPIESSSSRSQRAASAIRRSSAARSSVGARRAREPPAPHRPRHHPRRPPPPRATAPAPARSCRSRERSRRVSVRAIAVAEDAARRAIVMAMSRTARSSRPRAFQIARAYRSTAASNAAPRPSGDAAAGASVATGQADVARGPPEDRDRIAGCAHRRQVIERGAIAECGVAETNTHHGARTRFATSPRRDRCRATGDAPRPRSPDRSARRRSPPALPAA